MRMLQGERVTQYITSVAIGATAQCAIEARIDKYVFTVNDHSVELPRAIKTVAANGYWQYPYFGGNEVAPHPIFIYIEHL